MNKLRKPENKMRDYNKIKLQDGGVVVEYGACGISTHTDNSGCGTPYSGGTSCYPQSCYSY